MVYTDKQNNNLKDFWAIWQIVTTFPGYIFMRCRQLYIFGDSALELLLETASEIKAYAISRMFWGRGNMYRNSFHILITIFTATALSISFLFRFSVFQDKADQLQVAYAAGASADLLHQGNSIEAIIASDPSLPEVVIRTYTVENGDILDSISDRFGLRVDTIRWANPEVISPFSNTVVAGWKLRIPEIDGVLYTVRQGQDIHDVATLTNGEVYEIAELNQIPGPDYRVQAGQIIFVPNGTLSVSEVVVAGIPQGIFTNPLSHPDCVGYRLSQGFIPYYHYGLDLARYPGCPIRAVATGEVTFAGWSPLAGYNVRIDHGGGIVTHYYHSSGEFYVQKGDRVQQGQEIMFMGSSGNSTGVHLHIELQKDRVQVDPSIFIPF